MTRSQRHLVETVGYCDRATTIAQGGLSPCSSVPRVLSLVPDTAWVGDSDLDVHVFGVGFGRESRITHPLVRSSVYVSHTEMIAVLAPSKATGPTDVELSVQNGFYYSDPEIFKLTNPPPPA